MDRLVVDTHLPERFLFAGSYKEDLMIYCCRGSARARLSLPEIIPLRYPLGVLIPSAAG